VHALRTHHVLSAITERVHIARRRVGHDEVVDGVAVLFGEAISGERMLEAFSEHRSPRAPAFLALFGRDRVPARSTHSRCGAAVPEEPVDALRGLCLSALLARPLVPERASVGQWDRTGRHWRVFALDGTREAARQRAFPQGPERPAPQRRFRPRCAPGSTGRTRGDVVRSRTTIVQAPPSHWLGACGGPGHGKAWED
jgi:hypothetical protein